MSKGGLFWVWWERYGHGARGTGHVAWGTRWRTWLRHCVTSRKIVGLSGIFHWHNPYGRSVALGSTQPLTEMSTWNISLGVTAAGSYGWQPYHLHVPYALKSEGLNLLELSGPVQHLYRDRFTSTFTVRSLKELTSWFSLSNSPHSADSRCFIRGDSVNETLWDVLSRSVLKLPNSIFPPSFKSSPLPTHHNVLKLLRHIVNVSWVQF